MAKKKLQNKDCSKVDENAVNSIDPDNFTLLEEFQIESNLAVNASGVTFKGKGDVECKVKATPVKFNINNDIFNHLVNIHRCFTYESPEEIVQNMIVEKELVMAKSSLVSNVKKRGTNIKIWASRVAILSGRYLYLYRENNDLVEEENMFLKDAQIVDLSSNIGEKYAIALRSKFGNVMISFESQSSRDTWKHSIHKIVIELSSSVDKDEEVTQKEIEQKQRETNNDLFNLDLE